MLWDRIPAEPILSLLREPFHLSNHLMTLEEYLEQIESDWNSQHDPTSKSNPDFFDEANEFEDIIPE